MSINDSSLLSLKTPSKTIRLLIRVKLSPSSTSRIFFNSLLTMAPFSLGKDPSTSIDSKSIISFSIIGFTPIMPLRETLLIENIENDNGPYSKNDNRGYGYRYAMIVEGPSGSQYLYNYYRSILSFLLPIYVIEMTLFGL